MAKTRALGSPQSTPRSTTWGRKTIKERLAVAYGATGVQYHPLNMAADLRENVGTATSRIPDATGSSLIDLLALARAFDNGGRPAAIMIQFKSRVLVVCFLVQAKYDSRAPVISSYPER